MSVRVTVRKVATLTSFNFLGCKFQGIKISTSRCCLTFKIVLFVTYVSACALPEPRIIVRFNWRQYLHTVIIKGIRLAVVDYIKLEFVAQLSTVFNLEKKPLCVTISVGVILENKVKFIFFNLHSSCQIPRFKPRVKLQLTIIWFLYHLFDDTFNLSWTTLGLCSTWYNFRIY